MKTIKIKDSEELEQYYDKSRNLIEIKGNLECDSDIVAKYSLLVSGSIKSGVSIKSGKSIKSGGSIESGGYIFSFQFEIKAKSAKSKILPFWREYWAAMPVLSRYRDAILNESNCWLNLKALVSKEEAAEICAWEGWHPILRWHLEMFFGLKKEHVFD